MRGLDREVIRQRARARCECCLLPDLAMAQGDFYVEHVIPRKHAGSDAFEPGLGLHFLYLYKGPNLPSFDPDTSKLTRLFNPRLDRWSEHFRVSHARIIGLTAIGRTTIWLLEMNSAILLSL